MNINKVCSNCGSPDLMPNVRVIYYMDASEVDLTAVVYEKPYALFFKGRHKEHLTASVCGRCGFVEFYVSNPQELLAAYRRSIELRAQDRSDSLQVNGGESVPDV